MTADLCPICQKFNIFRKFVDGADNQLRTKGGTFGYNCRYTKPIFDLLSDNETQ